MKNIQSNIITKKHSYKKINSIEFLPSQSCILSYPTNGSRLSSKANYMWQKDKYCMIALSVESKTTKSSSHRKRIQRWMPGARGVDEIGKMLVKAHNPYKKA